MKKTILIIGSVIALSACASQPTLEEKLAGKSTPERKEILEQACLKEAGTGHMHHRTDIKIKRMKNLCHTMANEIK